MPLRPSVQTHLVDGHLVAEFWDCLRLDPAPVQALQGYYDNHLRAGGKADLIIDLSGVTFAGSTVLGGILKLQKVASKNDARVALCHVEPGVMEVIQMSNIENYFDFFPTREAALAYRANPASRTAPSGARGDGQAAPSRSKPAGEAPRGGPLSSRRRKGSTGG